MIIRSSKKPDIADIIALAKETGFTYAAPLEMDALVLREEVREMCAADRCRNYGKSWSCPPAAGTLEASKLRIEMYSAGIIVQTSGQTLNEFDLESINTLNMRHLKNFDTLVRQIRMFCPACMPMGAGACRRCHKCTYPDRPCRYPEKMYPSMEAYGLLVSDVCIRSGLKYNYGESTMTFTSCVLTDSKGVRMYDSKRNFH